MGHAKPHRPVLLMAAIFSRYESAMDWSRQKLTDTYGPVACQSDVFNFDQTPYYEREMGSDLYKQLLAFETLVEPDCLPSVKHRTNQLELDYADEFQHDEARPLNLDPGYISEAKLVLATTKDRDHRLYLGDGMYGEVTLYFQSGKWNVRPWTYPDYQSEPVLEFMNQARIYLRNRYQSDDSTSSR